MTLIRWFERELDTRWMRDAACATAPGLPWTENPKRVPTVLLELMAETCRTCPALDRCEGFVQEARVTAGWWAGASQNHRNPWGGNAADDGDHTPTPGDTAPGDAATGDTDQ